MSLRGNLSAAAPLIDFWTQKRYNIDIYKKDYNSRIVGLFKKSSSFLFDPIREQRRQLWLEKSSAEMRSAALF